MRIYVRIRKGACGYADAFAKTHTPMCARALARMRTGGHHIACGAEECIDSPGAREAHVMCIVHRQRDAQVRGCAIRAVHASGCAMRDA